MKTQIICLGILALAAGCGGPPGADYSQVELLSVSGLVTLDGNPLSEAVVTFEDPSTGTFSYGLTDSSGNYSLEFDSVKSGCTPGQKRVEISTTRKILGLNTSEEGGAPEGEGGSEGTVQQTAKEMVPPQYNKKSELTVEVSASSRKHDFALTSK